MHILFQNLLCKVHCIDLYILLLIFKTIVSAFCFDIDQRYTISCIQGTAIRMASPLPGTFAIQHLYTNEKANTGTCSKASVLSPQKDFEYHLQ